MWTTWKFFFFFFFPLSVKVPSKESCRRLKTNGCATNIKKGRQWCVCVA